MRHTRTKYHQAIKWAKQNEKNIRNERLAYSIANNDSRNLCVTGTINGIQGDEAIANIFADHFSQ